MPIRKVYNLIILDESGSMEAIKSATINSFNELIQQVAAEAASKPDREQWINFVSFNGNGIREQIPLQKVNELMKLDQGNYRPDSMTPLFDAIGHSTGKLRYAIEQAKDQDYVVLVTILTDGAENASKEFTSNTISNIVKELSQHNWVFTYMGTNQDVEKEAKRMAIHNHLKFGYSDVQMSMAMDKQMASRAKFYMKLDDENINLSQEKFFDDEEEGKK